MKPPFGFWSASAGLPVFAASLFIALAFGVAGCAGGGPPGPIAPPPGLTLQADPITPESEQVSLAALGVTDPDVVVHFYFNAQFLGDDATPPFGVLVRRSILPQVIPPASTWYAEVRLGNLRILAQAQVPVQTMASPVVPPQLTVFAPVNGEVVTGSYTIRVSASPPPASIRYFINNNRVAESITPPFQFILDTPRYTNGDHILTVVARYPEGVSTTRTLPFRIHNPIGQTAENWVRLVSPVPDGFLNNTVLVRAESSPNAVRVRFFINHQNVYEDFTPPFSFALDTSQYPDGPHLIEALADFGTGGSLSSAIIVIFKNRSPDPPPLESPVQITSPETGGSYNAPFNITLSIGNLPSPITEVEFYLNGAEIAERRFPPFSLEVDPRLVPRGTYTLIVKAKTETGEVFYHQVTITLA